MNKYRTHNCSELRLEKVGYDVVLSGWINKKRDHGNLLFLDLRDNFGTTQCIVEKDKPFFKDLIEYMTSEPVVIQVLSGNNCVEKYRSIMGATNPENAEDGTIRKLFALNVQENSVHGSDSNDNAKIEIDFFFKPEEIVG